MNMELPAWTSTKLAVKGIWAAIVGLLLITSAAVAVVMSVQLHGFKLWPINIEGWKPKAERLALEIEQMEKAQEQAAAAQKKVLDEQAQAYEQLAQEIDEDAQAEIEAIYDSTERFIRNNRLRAANIRCPSSGSTSPTGHNSAGDSEEVREASVMDAEENLRVAVLPEDVRICTANTLQAEAARAWAVELEELNHVDNP